MIQHEYLTPALATPLWPSSFGARITVWAAADGHASAVMNEQRSTLCHVELGRRGLGRATLASEMSEACDRSRHAQPPTGRPDS